MSLSVALLRVSVMLDDKIVIVEKTDSIESSISV